MASKTQMGVRLNMTLLYLIRRLVTSGNLTRCDVNDGKLCQNALLAVYCILKYVEYS